MCTFHQVRITVEGPENNTSSVDSAVPEDQDGSDEVSEEPLLERPRRQRNTDSVDSGDLSDTESHPSSLHLAELDEDEKPKVKTEYYNVVSCVADDAELPLQPNLHTIIIDCAPITFMDSSGAEVLEQVSFWCVVGIWYMRMYIIRNIRMYTHTYVRIYIHTYIHCTM